MNTRFALSPLSFLCVAASLVLAPAAMAQGIVIDHTCATLEGVPASAIQRARETLHIAYGHTSHGSQLITGMGALVEFMDTKPNDTFPDQAFAFNAGGTGGALDLRDTPFSGAQDLGNPNRTAWATATRNYLGTPTAAGRGSARPEINVIVWSWCGQVDGSESDIATYLGLMSGLEADYPGVRFVYMTGHLNGGGATGNVHVRNNQIREYCSAHGKVLYDFADIESYDPDGRVNYMELRADDACDYDSDGDGSRDRNWATHWQDTHVRGVDWFDCSAAHSQPLNGNRKAYAAWQLWARLAGWSGPTATEVRVTDVPGLRAAMLAANASSAPYTVVLADGIYRLAENLPFLTAQNFTVRGESGNAAAVILEGGGMTSGSVTHIFNVAGHGFTISDVTLQRVRNHGIQLQVAIDRATMRRVVFRDIYEQMLKVAASADSDPSDDGLVEDCVFEYTAATGPNWYIGGVDGHRCRNWVVRNCTFRNIASPSGAVAEHAIHFWNDSRDTRAEGNTIINCDRGIGFGLGSSAHAGGVISNNMIYNGRTTGFYDAGITLESAPGVQVHHNTVFLANDYPHAIEYRFAATTGGAIVNNLANKIVRQRDGASATVSHNVTSAVAGWFRDPAAGDLRLAGAIAGVVDAGTALPASTADIEGDPRPFGAAADIGADEYLDTEDTTPPGAPADLAGAAGSSRTVRLIWTQADDDVGVTGYRLFRDGALVASTTDNVYLDTGLVPATNYSYRVEARDAAGNLSAPSPVAMVRTDAVESGRLVRAEHLVYRGAFLLPADAAGGYAYGGTAIGYHAARHSLFVRGHDWYQLVGEVSVPEPILASDVRSLNTATVLQSLTDVTEGHLGRIGAGGAEISGSKIGGLLVHEGRLIGTSWAYYDAGGNARSSHFVSGLDLDAPGDFAGMYTVGPYNPGFVAGYLALVPEEWREALGGPVLTGLGGIPIISRSSYGPAASVFDPADLGRLDPVPAPLLAGYPAAHPTLGTWGNSEEPNPEFNMTTGVSGVVFPPGSDSVLFFGTTGTGVPRYGQGTDDPALDGQPVPGTDGEVVYAYDPASGGKGCHAYPYVGYVWAYRAADLARVAAGQLQPWQVAPYATWELPFPFGSDGHDAIAGATYDPLRQRILVSQYNAVDASPVIHVYDLRMGDPADTAAPSIPGSVAAATGRDGGVVLTWAASADDGGLLGYRVYRDGALVGWAPGTEFVDTDLPGSGTYDYSIRAIDRSGNASAGSTVARYAAAPGLLVPGTRFPVLLSATGVFSDTVLLTPAPSLVPYAVVVPAWSDFAESRHWVHRPAAGGAFAFAEDAPWTFPAGTTWVQHLEVETVGGDPATRARVETRILVRTADGAFGATYRWNADQTDAVLVPPEGADVEWILPSGAGAGARRWSIPSRASCVACHNADAGYALGFTTRQLNRSGPVAGEPDNQIAAWAAEGWLDRAPEPTTLPAHAALVDTRASLEARARSWLDANCAGCHRPGAAAGARGFDLRAGTALGLTGLVNGPVEDPLGDPDMRLITPDFPERSALAVRVHATGVNRMPACAGGAADPLATRVIREWIHRLAMPADAREARLDNLSTRGVVRSGEAVMIGGFVVAGANPRRVLLRGVGPALGPMDVHGVLPDPRIALYRDGRALAENDDWGSGPDPDAVRAAAESAGAFALAEGGRDAALLATLEPGAYTVHLMGPVGADAIGMFEAYDITDGGDSRLVNLSTRLWLGQGERVAIPGLVIGGETRRTFLVRVVGPGLAAFDLEGVLADPKLTVMAGGTLVADNDDWGAGGDAAALARAAREVGAFPLEPGSRDAALLITLEPGVHTVVTEGSGSSEGLVLVEIYEVL